MKSKKKFLIITALSLMALIIIGLTIGIVLVASQATVGNQITVKYTANNVDAEIEVSAEKYLSPTDNGSIVKVNGKDTETITFNYSQAEAISELVFDTVELDATGRAVFTFNITNSASEANTKVLKALVSTDSLTSSDNIILSVGIDENSTIELTPSYSEYYTEIGAGQESNTITLVVKVDDHNVDINEFKLNLNILLSYNIEEPTVATTEEFVDTLTTYTELQNTQYYYLDGSGNEVYTTNANEASTKIEHYPTVDMIYTNSNYTAIGANRIGASNTATWTYSGYIVTNTKHIQINNDIDISELSETFSDNAIASIILEGALDEDDIPLYTLYMDGEKLSTTTDNFLFNTLIDSEIKNLNVEFDGKIGGFTQTGRGTILFENIWIYGNAYMGSDDHNKGVFIKYNYTDNLTFRSCIYGGGDNSAFTLTSTAKYFGLFVNGYGKTTGTVNFYDCEFAGTVYSTGNVGILFGNPQRSPQGGINISNLYVYGKIYYSSTYQPHVLAAQISSTNTSNGDRFRPAECPILDQSIGEDTLNYRNGLSELNVDNLYVEDGFFEKMTAKFTATDSETDLSDLVLTSSSGTLSSDLTYTLTLYTRFTHKDYANGVADTYLATINIDLDVDSTVNSQTFDNVLRPIVDKKTYIENGGTIPTNAVWKPIANNNGEYNYCKTDTAYIIDFNGDYDMARHSSTSATWNVVAKDSTGAIKGFANGGNLPYIGAINYFLGTGAEVLMQIEATEPNYTAGTIYTPVTDLSTIPGISNATTTLSSNDVSYGYVYIYNEEDHINNEPSGANNCYQLKITITNNTSNKIRVRAGAYDYFHGKYVDYKDNNLGDISCTLTYIGAGESVTIYTTTAFNKPFTTFNINVERKW